MYKLLKSDITHEINGVQRLSDMAFLRIDEESSDYQQYLKWVAEGNTPLPADEPTQGE